MAQTAKNFLEALAETKLSYVERTVALLWWHSKIDSNAVHSLQTLVQEIQDAGYARPNITRLREALRTDRRLLKASGERFRLRIEARREVGEQFSRYRREDDEPIPDEPSVPRATSLERDKQRVDRVRPSVFIGSSKEGLGIAKALQENLDHEADSTIWSQGLFGLSTGTLETLATTANDFDFAVLILTPDDVTIRRGQETQSPRDNVLFELGLFIGVLGRKRTFIVHPRDKEMHLPSDLGGITPSTYVSTRSDGNLTAALGVVATQLEREFRRHGVRQRLHAHQ